MKHLRIVTISLVSIFLTCFIITPAQADLPDGWLKGNTHTHSNLSDGDSPPATVAAHYQDLGYDFLVLTDHNRISNFSQYSTIDFLCIDGEEIGVNDPFHHTNGIGLTSKIFTSTLQANVNAVLAQGGVPQLNHPGLSGLDAADIIPVDGLGHMEIFNAVLNWNDEDIWDGVLTSGKLVYGVASDDSHALFAQSGRGWIVVRSDILSLEAIQDALDTGDYYASSGVILNDYHVDSAQMTVDSQNGDLIEFIGANGEILELVVGSAGSYQFKGNELYVRARISNTLLEYAWTQPRFVSIPDGDLAPYGSPDGNINAADVLIATRIALQQIPAEPLTLAHGDMNSDGQIDLSDILVIIQLVLN
jgi:hypothetical protein